MRGGLVGDFYQVIKTIKGHRYLYKQRTFRRGGQVCTESHYIGPAGAGDVARITAEREVRRDVPTFGQVAAAVKLLADPKRAATAWLKPWGEKGAVNTTFARHDSLDRHLASLGVTIVEHPDAEGAAYNMLHDAVVIPSGSRFHDRPNCTSTEAFYFTLMHEVAHWTGSVNRLNRTVIGKGRVDSPKTLEIYAREEMVVETTALLVMAKSGLPMRDKAQSAWYFQYYLGMVGNKEAALEYVQNEAHRASEYILASSKLRAIKAQHGLV